MAEKITSPDHDLHQITFPFDKAYTAKDIIEAIPHHTAHDLFRWAKGLMKEVIKKEFAVIEQDDSRAEYALSALLLAMKSQILMGGKPHSELFLVQAQAHEVMAFYENQHDPERKLMILEKAKHLYEQSASGVGGSYRKTAPVAKTALKRVEADIEKLQKSLNFKEGHPVLAWASQTSKRIFDAVVNYCRDNSSNTNSSIVLAGI